MTIPNLIIAHLISSCLFNFTQKANWVLSFLQGKQEQKWSRPRLEWWQGHHENENDSLWWAVLGNHQHCHAARESSRRQQISTAGLMQRSCNGWFCTQVVASWHCQPFPFSMACDLHGVNNRTYNLGSNSMTGSDIIEIYVGHISGTIVYSRNLLYFLDAFKSLSALTIFYLYMSYDTFGFRD